MKEAFLYEKLDGKKVKCHLCNHYCLIPDGKRGICQVRENRGGILYSLVYERLIAANVDPIEKKPFFHFLPGSRSFSIASVGCNFRCKHCQNWSISQMPRDRGQITGERVPPERIVLEALRTGCKSISYTYTEPTVFFEYAYETSKLAKEKGLKNLFVTNGYMSQEALQLIAPYLDGANVDLKSASDTFYKEICGASLNPVIENIRTMKELGIWVEVTTLLIPTLNDSEEELKTIARLLRDIDPRIPWHVTAFHPNYQLLHLPPTPRSVLKRAREIGLSEGLKYVYSGNIPGDEGENTYCWNCHKILIRRWGFNVLENHIKEGKCPHCGAEIDGVGL